MSTVVTIYVDGGVVTVLRYIMSYIISVAYHIQETWVDGNGALVSINEYKAGDIHVVEYVYVENIKVIYTYVDDEFRHVRCYDGNEVVYSGSVYKGVSNSEYKPVITKKIIDHGVETTLDIWPTGCVSHSSVVFDKVYNPFEPIVV